MVNTQYDTLRREYNHFLCVVFRTPVALAQATQDVIAEDCNEAPLPGNSAAEFAEAPTAARSAVHHYI